MQADILPQREALLEQLNHAKGQWIEIQEYITRVPGNLNRHFSTHSLLVFELESVGVTTSGAHLSLWGTLAGKQLSYQIACDLLGQLKQQEAQWQVIENLAPTSERHSWIRVLSKTNPLRPNQLDKMSS